MATDPDLKRELAEERRELTHAGADLRDELNHTAERGKQVGTMVAAVAGAALAIRTALTIRRRFGDHSARRTAPKRAASASTIDARTGATSSSVSVPSREPKASRKA